MSQELYTSVEKEDLNKVKLLLEGGEDPDTYSCDDHAGDTLLHIAVVYSNLKLAALLLRHGANVNAGNNFDETPLHYAAHWSTIEMAKLLLSHGGNVRALARDKKTVIDYSKRSVCPGMEKFLRGNNTSMLSVVTSLFV